MSTKNLLSKNDASFLLELIHSSLSCVTEEHLIGLINRLKSLFTYEFAVCALVRAQASIDESHFINVSFPPDWCSLYVAEGFDRTDPVVRESAGNGHGIQYWTDTYKKYDAKGFISCARDFGLVEGYSHGVRTPSGDKRSLFSFAGRSVGSHPRTELILDYVVPHLDQAFERIVGVGEKKPSRSGAELSSREREILNWVKRGKSTWEISVILSISANTVQFHMKSIMRKLGVVSRPQAVAVALQNGLLRME
jgi:DNA-binding CsgD family transcriptional regulator